MPRTDRSSRKTALALVAAAAAAALVGCSGAQGAVCPAVGWVNAVAIDLRRAPAALDRIGWVELCDATRCSESAAERELTGEADPVSPEPPYYSARDAGDGRWVVDVMMASPSRVTVRAWSSEGRMLAETAVFLDWQRTGGSEECPTSSAADPIELVVLG